MDVKPKVVIGDRYQELLKSLSKCKIEFTNEKEECKKIREINSKLEIELKETRELEKSHRYHLQQSREMIGNLQETVSQLVYLKRDMKRLKDEIIAKDASFQAIETDKENLIHKHNVAMHEIQAVQEKILDELTAGHEKKVHQIQHDLETQIAQFTCAIEELRCKIKEKDDEHRDKMNIVVLEYEEKIQRGAAQLAQLQDQLARQTAHTDTNIEAYRRRLEELEEKLKQTQFKQYLAQSSYGCQYESQVERPYSVEKDYPDCSVDLDPIPESSKAKSYQPSQLKTPRQQNTLQVMYYGNKPPQNVRPNEKKGPFSITKKRKLYSEKDQEF